jgi:hypothetical protein
MRSKMKVTWVGPGNIQVGKKLIPPGVPEATFEMSEEAFFVLYNERQRKKFFVEKPKAKTKKKVVVKNVDSDV